MLLAFPAALSAQEKIDEGLDVGGTPIYQRPPFDRVTLDAANSRQVFEVVPLGDDMVPGRKVPESPNPNGKFEFRSLADDQVRATTWRHIAKVELYEEMVLFEAARLLKANRLEEAWKHLLFLHRNYPDTAGLKGGMHAYQFRSAVELFRANRVYEALSALEGLSSENPKYGADQGMKALDSVARKVVSDYVAKDDLPSAQVIMRRLLANFDNTKLPAVAEIRAQLQQRAIKHRDETRANLKDGKRRDAYLASQEMLRIWADVPGASDVAREAAQAYPRAVVGVQQLPSRFDPASLDNWTARRAGRLTQRLLMEFGGASPNGGKYTTPYGELALTEDFRRLTIQLERAARGGEPLLTGYELSRRLKRLADPRDPLYRADWAAIFSRVSVEDVFRVQVDLRQPHVLPQSLLRVPLEDSSSGAPPSPHVPYVVEEATTEFARFLANPQCRLGEAGGPMEIVERRFPDRDAALTALRRGEIDALDRITSNEAANLRAVPNVVVGRYAHPTMHVLVPNHDKPFPKHPNFRAGVEFAIPRKQLLDQLVLRGQTVPGSMVLSGAFPAGTSANDPLAYAYDTNLRPRGFDLRMGAMLMAVTVTELVTQARRQDKEAPKLNTIVIGHPAEELPRTVCQQIAEYLNKIQLPKLEPPLLIQVKLKELAPGESTDPTGECDFVYTEVAVWEPIADARRLLGGGSGTVLESSQHLDQGLRRLEASKNWREVQRALIDIHHWIHTEDSVIPLFQTVNFFAYRKGLDGVGNTPVTLYQNVEKWRITPNLR